MSKQATFFLSAFVLVFLALPTLGSSSHTVRLRDDAYHYRYFADDRHDANYVEWWYFNLFDVTQDVQLAFTYSILDPENKSGFGLASVLVIVYTPRDHFDEGNFFPPDSFDASYKQSDVLISDEHSTDLHSIEVIDEDSYRVVGAVEGEHTVSWDLTYLRQGESWFGHRREKVGLFPWEHMSWLVYMPGARVSGQVVIDGQVYHLRDVPGYHDHNWGEWIPTTVAWNWAQYFEPGLSLSVGDFRNTPVGVVSIALGEDRVIYEKDQYRLVHTRWRYDPVHQQRYPITTWLLAENERGALLVRLETLETEAVLAPPEIPFPVVEPIIYEQTAYYQGTFWEKGRWGTWEPKIRFSGNGFKEYTARRRTAASQD